MVAWYCQVLLPYNVFSCYRMWSLTMPNGSVVLPLPLFPHLHRHSYTHVYTHTHILTDSPNSPKAPDAPDAPNAPTRPLTHSLTGYQGCRGRAGQWGTWNSSRSGFTMRQGDQVILPGKKTQ